MKRLSILFFVLSVTLVLSGIQASSMVGLQQEAVHGGMREVLARTMHLMEEGALEIIMITIIVMMEEVRLLGLKASIGL